MGEYLRATASKNGNPLTLEYRKKNDEDVVNLLHRQGYVIVAKEMFSEWDSDRLFLLDTDTKVCRGHDETERELTFDWELFEAYGCVNELDHYEVWINGRWSSDFDTQEEAREYIRVYGR
ncbi:MAG: hypothetical protein IJ716_11600 [Lachnospiraceae bacterium]|nr:hypothetical protein [Lachnospiraceae bacterium]